MMQQPPPVLVPVEPGALPSVHVALYEAIIRAEKAERWDEATQLRDVWEGMCHLVPSGAMVFRSEVWAEIMEYARSSDSAWQVRHQLRQMRPGVTPQGPLAVRIDDRTWRTDTEYRRGTTMLHALGAAMRMSCPPLQAEPTSTSASTHADQHPALREQLDSPELAVTMFR